MRGGVHLITLHPALPISPWSRRSPQGGELQFEISTRHRHDARTGGRIFEPAIRADASMTRRYCGTGLGLAISKRLAACSGPIVGRKRARHGSVPAHTGRYLALLSPRQSHARFLARRVRPWSAGGRNKLDCRILLAYDGPDNRRLLAYILRGPALRLTHRRDGQWRWSWALARKATAAVRRRANGMQMPILDGYGATDLLRILATRARSSPYRAA